MAKDQFFMNSVIVLCTFIMLGVLRAPALKQTVQRRVASTQLISFRSFADIQVEHGRGQWKTYGDVGNYNPGNYQIKTFNKISAAGLARFPLDSYEIRTQDEEAANAHAILLRSHKLQEHEVAHTVRAIARYDSCVDMLCCNL